MASMNKVLILGNLGSDPEIAYTQSGQAVAHFNLATNDVWTDKQGNRQERTEWHRVVVWGKQGEHCKEYLKKGRTAFVEGRLQTRTFDDKQGQKRTITEVVAQNVQFIGGGARAGGEDGAMVEPPNREPEGLPVIKDDDVPF